MTSAEHFGCHQRELAYLGQLCRDFNAELLPEWVAIKYLDVSKCSVQVVSHCLNPVKFDNQGSICERPSLGNSGNARCKALGLPSKICRHRNPPISIALLRDRLKPELTGAHSLDCRLGIALLLLASLYIDWLQLSEGRID